ncbi:MAG: tRNA pseudouridine(55) synthase TruB [Candidatus Gastranaerophilaceae bacterium]
MFGFLNVYKPIGKTSHDVVAYFRKVLKIKQIGHTGTLDPFAEGVLPICIGKATRLIEYLDDEKAYLAFVQFGKSTDTYDTEGKVTFISNKIVNQEEIINALKSFEGEIEQIPPIFSAIKVEGKKLYEYAREGKTIQIEPRKVVISKIELRNFDAEKQLAQIYIECSKGTYIRSIANDLGQNLECGAYLTKLIREKAGKFLVNESKKLEELDSVEKVSKNLLSPVEIINLEKVNLTKSEHEKVLHGQPIVNKSIKSDDFIILVYNNNISAIAKHEGGVIKVKKVFDNV